MMIKKQSATVITAGDPRFDQVFLRSRNRARVDHLKPVFENRPVLVAGSVWENCACGSD